MYQLKHKLHHLSLINDCSWLVVPPRRDEMNMIMFLQLDMFDWQIGLLYYHKSE